MPTLNPKVQSVIDALLPRYQKDVLSSVIEKDDNDKPTNARMLRTPWHYKMMDAFKVSYGQFNLGAVLKDSWGSWLDNLLPPNIVEDDSFKEPLATLKNYHLKYKDKEFTSANVSDWLLAPFDLAHSLFNIISKYGIFLATLPLQLLMLLFVQIKLNLSEKGHVKAAKVFNIAAMIVGFVPLAVLSFAMQLVNTLFLIAREVTKFTLSVVMTAASTVIVSAVDLFATFKAYRLFNLAKKLPMSTYSAAALQQSAVMREDPEPESHEQKLKNTRHVLSALRREKLEYRIDYNNMIQIFDPREPSQAKTLYTITAEDAKLHPNAISAYYQLNLLKSMTAERQTDLQGFCEKHEIGLQTSGRIGEPESLSTPLL